MTSCGATAYFCTLSDALLALEVTDQFGTPLLLDEGAVRAVDMLANLRRNGGKAMVIGNGGSAAIATHVHNDLCKAVGVRALSLTDLPLFSALSNDCGYPSVYEYPMNLWADTDDLVIAISSSGRSENILRAVTAGARRGCHVITLSGFAADNPLRTSGILNFYVPSNTYGCVELAHGALAHYLTDTAAAVAAGLAASR